MKAQFAQNQNKQSQAQQYFLIKRPLSNQSNSDNQNTAKTRSTQFQRKEAKKPSLIQQFKYFLRGSHSKSQKKYEIPNKKEGLAGR